MIPTNRVLFEIENQLKKAKEAGQEAAVREALSAIRSLCDIVLQETPQVSAGAAGQGRPVSYGSASEAYANPVPVQGVPQAVQPASLEGKLLREDDANGGSLFDF